MHKNSTWRDVISILPPKEDFMVGKIDKENRDRNIGCRILFLLYHNKMG